MTLSLKNIFYALGIIFLLFAAMILAKSIVFPLSLALMLAFILFPLTRKIESWGAGKALATFLSLLSGIILIGGFIFLFSTQLMQLSGELSAFREKITGLVTDVIYYVNQNIGFVNDISREELLADAKEWLKSSAGSLLGKTVNSSANFLTNLITIIIYTFLILIYRNYLTEAFVRFGKEENRTEIRKMLRSIQRVGQKYLSGMFVLIIILGLVNSIGLWIIGIDSPFLFGFLAALLSIVPYVGTTVGATIPVLYAFMTYDSLWIPLAIALMFWVVQLIESNFLNPKIVGSSINVNPLAAILSLIIGAAVWGVAGMVLFLPFAAMLKVFCDEFESLRPIAMLIGNDEQEENNKPELIKKVKAWFK